MIINKMLCRAGLVLFFLALALVTPVRAQEAKKIVIMPFEIYGKGDNAVIRKLCIRSYRLSSRRKNN